jgi:hypothetical protein
MAFWKSASAIVLFALLSVLCWAAEKPSPKYDKSTEVTVKGTIEDIKLIPGPNEGIHVMLKTGDQTILVHIAPEKFLKEMDLNLKKGDKLEVTGSKVKTDDGDEILAKSISLDANNTFTLRDEKGAPVWLGWIK